MSRELAILSFTIFTVWLWHEDRKRRPYFSKALWIPLIWLLLLASRPLSWWSWFFFGVGSPSVSDLDGNALDRAFYSALICLSIIVLIRRGVSWNDVFRGNTGLLLFYAFLGLTILWAAYPFPTFKRWTKELGAIPVLLIIVTDKDPIEAIKAVFTRCAFVIFTFSVLTIKYIPEISRDYNRHSGIAEIHGICDQKNSLGEAVMAFGLVVLWQLLDYRGHRPRDYLKSPALQWVLTLLMGVWLLRQCDSKTSIIGFLVGAAMFVSTKVQVLNKRRAIVWVCLVAVPVFVLLDNMFHVSGPILNLLGRDATLTNRTEIWAATKAHPVDPMFGCGYLNFWDIVGPIKLGESAAVELKTAHNGYLEIFLDGGYLGILFLVIMLINAGRNHVRSFVHDYPGGVLAMAIFCMLLLTNISESVFARRGPLWSAFLLTTIGYRFLARAPDHAEEDLTMEDSYGFAVQPKATDLVPS
jgi:exopolysaccharide production protein ExoQ